VRADSLGGLKVCLCYAFSILVSTQGAVAAALGADGAVMSTRLEFLSISVMLRENRGRNPVRAVWGILKFSYWLGTGLTTRKRRGNR